MTITRFDVDLPTDVEDGAYVTYEDHLEELRAETQRRQAAEAVVDAAIKLPHDNTASWAAFELADDYREKYPKEKAT